MTNPAFLIAFFTTLVQCYDYALFGLSAAVLSKHFMPPSSDAQQMLNFFAVFAVAVLGRPVGSIIFGKIADKYGRIVSVKIASLLAAASTAIIGIAPNFETIGFAATAILALCRMAFLMSLAGEVDATRIYVAEKIGKLRRNLANGLVSFFSQFGAFIAAASYHLSLVFDRLENLWRISFLIGGALGVVVILLRKYFEESEEFINYKATHKERKNDNILTIIKQHKLKFILALLISGTAGGTYHFLIIFFSTFSANILEILSKEQARLLNIGLILIYASSAVISGFVADKITPKKQIITALFLSLTLTIAMQFFIPAPSGSGIGIITIVVMLVVLLPFYTVPLQVRTQFIFAVDVRTRMSSLSHSIGGMIFSSTTPFFCMLIWKHTNSMNIVLVLFMMLLTILLSSAASLLNLESH